MLIKSQNGTQIVNLDNCISISIDGNNHIIAFYPFVDGYDKLGKYSSIEKAQRVLNWIWECYRMFQLLKLNSYGNPKELFDEYVADQNFELFRMPNDEEVEE